jgi:hypothetical protein
VAFSVLPTRHLAGVVVGESLTRLHIMGLGAGVVYLLTSAAAAKRVTGSAQWSSGRTWLLVAMIAVTLASEYGVTPRMHSIRNRIEERGATFDQLPPADTDRRSFDRLHKLSVQLETAVLVLGLIAIYPTVKFPS